MKKLYRVELEYSAFVAAESEYEARSEARSSFTSDLDATVYATEVTELDRFDGGELIFGVERDTTASEFLENGETVPEPVEMSGTVVIKYDSLGNIAEQELPAIVVGAFAVHRTIGSETYFNVTHVPSCMAVKSYVDDVHHAVEIAKLFDEHAKKLAAWCPAKFDPNVQLPDDVMAEWESIVKPKMKELLS